MPITCDDTVSERPRSTRCGFAPEELKNFFEQSESLAQPGETSEANQEAMWTRLEEFEQHVARLRVLCSSSMDTHKKVLNSGSSARLSDHPFQADEASPAARIPNMLGKTRSARISIDSSLSSESYKHTRPSTRTSRQSLSDKGPLPHGFEECSPSSISSQLQKSFAAFRRELSRDFQDWKRDLCSDFQRMMQGANVVDETCVFDKIRHSGHSGPAKSSLSRIAENEQPHVHLPQLPSPPSMYRADSTGTTVQSTGTMGTMLTIHSTGTRDAMRTESDSSSYRGIQKGLPSTHHSRRTTTTIGTANMTAATSGRSLSSILYVMSRISANTRVQGTLFGNVDAVLADQALKDADPYNVENLYHASGLAQWVVASRFFNVSVLVMICLNTLYLAIEADYNHKERLVDSHWAFQLSEIAFSSFFVLEISIRFGAFARKRDCLGDLWFVVDSLLTLHMLVDTYVLLNVRPVRFFRLLRLLRFARLFRASSAMATIMKAIYAGARAIASTMAMVVFLTYLFALALHSLLVDEKSMREYFGDIPASMWTLVLQGIFMDDISPVFANLRKIRAPVSIVLLLAFVLLSNLVMINVLLGILCEVVSKVAKADEDSQARSHLARATLALLQSLDIDSNRCINKGEFLELFRDPNALATLEDLRIDAEYVHGMTEILFTSADAELPIPLMVDLLLKHRIERPCHTGEMMRAMKMQRLWAARQHEQIADEVTRSVRDILSSSIHL